MAGRRLTAALAPFSDLASSSGAPMVLAAAVAELACAPSRRGAGDLAAVAPRLAALVEAAPSPAHGHGVALARARSSVRPLLPEAAGAVAQLADGEPGPWLLGLLRESLLEEVARRRGAHYTPAHLAREIVAFGLCRTQVAAAVAAGEAPMVCDPACGGGVFLVAAAGALAAAGVAPAAAVEHCLWGCDVDPLSVAVSEAALRLWALGQTGMSVEGPGAHLVQGDALTVEPRRWPGAPSDGFDVVVGNPPFQTPLARRNAAAAGGAEIARPLAALRRPYTDVAALFLAQAVRLARPGGRVALVQPLSVVSQRDSAPVRAWIDEHARLCGWLLPGSATFAADVHTCVPLLQRRSDLPSDQDRPTLSWAASVAPALGIPPVRLDGRCGVLGDLATATAGFRDHFYGLAPHVIDAPAGDSAEDGSWMPLITSGLIDPARNRWGMVPARFAGRRFVRPALPAAAVADLPPALAGWVRARCRPKLLVATQSRVAEVVVDATGRLIPSVPVIAVHAGESDLWRLAAAVSAPPVTAWSMARTVGAARDPGSLKLAAREVLQLPLPVDARAWEDAAGAFRLAAEAARDGDEVRWVAALRSFGEIATAAYGVALDDPVLRWWTERLPPWR